MTDEEIIDQAKRFALPRVRIPLRIVATGEPDEAEVDFTTSPPTVRRYVSVAARLNAQTQGGEREDV